MKVSVTAEDIEMAQALCSDRRNLRPHCCPVALALLRTVGSEQGDVSVFSGMCSYHKSPYDGEPSVVRLPFEARNFVHDFDRGLAVKPFEFDI